MSLWKLENGGFELVFRDMFKLLQVDVGGNSCESLSFIKQPSLFIHHPCTIHTKTAFYRGASKTFAASQLK